MPAYGEMSSGGGAIIMCLLRLLRPFAAGLTSLPFVPQFHLPLLVMFYLFRRLMSCICPVDVVSIRSEVFQFLQMYCWQLAEVKKGGVGSLEIYDSIV